MRRALRAISNLRACPESDAVFRVFLGNRNNLEEPLDLNGMIETSNLLLQAVGRSIADKELIVEAKKMAQVCASKAVEFYHASEMSGMYSDTQLAAIKANVTKVVDNWARI
jgi:hypothetical protein